MAKLLSPPTWYGTRYGVCVYKSRGENLVRKASSLDGKRVKTAPEFKNTRIWAERMKEAARLAGAVYDMLPPSRRKFRFFRKLTGQAMRLLKEGGGEGAVVVELMIFIRLPKRNRRKKTGKKPPGKTIKPFARVSSRLWIPSVRKKTVPVRNRHRKRIRGSIPMWPAYNTFLFTSGHSARAAPDAI
ncbi:MAG: hypothetical protein JST39_17550 [Bacteroidetes bacterium]|nr:hypothetical protein [Bacteroidota bacterium]